MMLSDMGAEIIRVERKGYKHPLELKYDPTLRGRKAIVGIDLKNVKGVQALLKLVGRSDILFEGFRPGVMEKLGLGPEVCLERNPKLVYGRVTGWGQSGPLSSAAGHDINYISLAGALHSIGRPEEKPVPPINLLGDYGGGGMLLAFGIVCALFDVQRSGRGQVVDATMVDGVALLMATTYGLLAAKFWSEDRGTNFLDGGAHFYDAYETADGKYISIGSIEPQFYALLLEHMEITDPIFKDKMDKKRWPSLKEKISTIFKTKTRDEWCEIMEGTDICFAPVLSPYEAIQHPHNVARKTFVDVQGVIQPGPAPRFSRTQPEIQGPPPTPFEKTESVLSEWGLSSEEIEDLKASEVI
jgi:alpha-methylacyl-CoA racemase